jgi:hypothetical protein
MLQELMLLPMLLEDPLKILLHRGWKYHVLDAEIGIRDAEEPFELSPWLGDRDRPGPPLNGARLRADLIDQLSQIGSHFSMAQAGLMRGELQGDSIEAGGVLLAEALDQSF